MYCKYCFYADELENNLLQTKSFMNLETFEILINKIFSEQYSYVSIVFQGGEPTLIGLDFYKNCVSIVNKLNSKNATISYALQTNGLLIDKDFADFFAENNYLIGLSLDGNKKTHDVHRLIKNEKGSFTQVFNAVRILQNAGVDVNILSVVTPTLVKNIKEVYEFYERNNLLFQQYIPCIDSIASNRGSDDWSLTPQVYGIFLIKLFDLWYQSFLRGKPVSIRYFENIIAVLLDRLPESCGMLGQCSKQYVIEADGSVYPCDFYVLPEFKLGNILSNSILELDIQRSTIQFIELSRETNAECQKCKWKKLCRGGCRRDREDFSTNKLEKNYFCESYKAFFEYSFEKFIKIITILSKKS